METHRREQISALYHAALERQPAERSAFLKEACEGDPGLQNELESMLQYEVAAAGVLDTPAADRSPINTDRNLLFAVLALQADVLDADQFVKICLLWTSRKHVAIGDRLMELGWITPIDRADVERLVDRKVNRHGGDPKAGLAAVADPVKRSLAALHDEDIQRSLAGLPASAALTTTAVDEVKTKRDERYTLTRLHASGGIGRVWLARDTEFGRDVALKELQPERADHPTHRARFLQEAHITGQLEHPGIVPVYELVLQPASQQAFYTMRFVKGRTLTEAVHRYHQSRARSPSALLDFVPLLSAFVTVCHTIAYAHSRGVIHRDLKGENVVLGDLVKLLSWTGVWQRWSIDPTGKGTSRAAETTSDPTISV